MLHQRQSDADVKARAAGPVVKFLDNFASPSSRGNAINKKYNHRGSIRKRKAVLPSSNHKDEVLRAGHNEETHHNNEDEAAAVAAATDYSPDDVPTVDAKREQLREKLSAILTKYRKKQKVVQPAKSPARTKKQIQKQSEVVAKSRAEMGPVTAINIIGERHSGTDWITDHLIDCVSDFCLVHFLVCIFVPPFQMVQKADPLQYEYDTHIRTMSYSFRSINLSSVIRFW